MGCISCFAGTRKGETGTSFSLWQKPLRPASAPLKRAADSPDLTSKLAATIAQDVFEHGVPAIRSSDMVSQRAPTWAPKLEGAVNSEAQEDTATISAASESGSYGEALSESHLSPLASVPGNSPATSSQSPLQRDVVSLECASMTALQMQAQYSDKQCFLKRKLLAEVLTATKEWNSDARKAACLLHISACEQGRQRVQNQLYDTRSFQKTLIERECKIHPDVPKADVGFCSSSQGSSASFQPAFQSYDSGAEDASTRGVGETDYLRNRVLAAYAMNTGRATSPMPLRTSLLDEDNDFKCVSKEEVGQVGMSPLQVDSIPPRGREGSGSPTRRKSRRSQSPLAMRSLSPLSRRERARTSDGDNVTCEQDEEKRQVRESQEAIIQILGLPSQAQLAEEAWQRQHVGKKLPWHPGMHDRETSKIRRIVPVVSRTMHSVVTDQGLTNFDERRRDKDRLKGRGLSTPFGKPMEVCFPFCYSCACPCPGSCLDCQDVSAGPLDSIRHRNPSYHVQGFDPSGLCKLVSFL